MEGDAGTSRLNPPPMPKFRRLRGRRPKNQDPAAAVDPIDSGATPEDSAAPDGVIEPPAPDVTVEEPAETEVAAGEPAGPEDATEQAAPQTAADEPSEPGAELGDAVERRPSRMGRGWLAGIAAVLVMCAAAVGVGGYVALRYHHESQAIARNDAAALKAAVDCVSATQAPDTNAMAASEQKIIDCGTDAFRSQALLYTSMLVQAYQAANVHVQVSDMRAAVERNNPDGSVEVLVAVRVKVANDQTQNETGYRLRVKMAQSEGQYKIAKLDQVTK
ncbi:MULTISPECIES: Mce protein [unclassified Mycobacterium]|uniref:Mce protein n=1 Tax=unclassified Mycobacterium TaxID=2642494 RepID=UPI0007FD75FA|nr:MULTISPECIES: Mce protein [unclassified Mycobacterium]OBG48644.1 Mce protein [Mycobacterium sp. E735]OBG62761.1 Mce protein [Mycobacterium sp. E188]OBG74018.1 Mce protein [Mycobacterium sp. E3305]OBH33016.1 Mce protein [Mycobacterium sp. E1715]OBH42022.1 Mce protein [Mycobacterium sp. E183]